MGFPRPAETTLAKVAVTAVAIWGPPLIAMAWTTAVGLFAEADPLGGWGSLIQTFGIAVACLAALSFAVWRSLVFIGKNVVIPVAERHIRFLDEVAMAIKSHTELLAATEARLEKLEVVIHARSVVIAPEGGHDKASPGGGR